MNSPKQILLLIVFLSVFSFQNAYSQIPDSIKLTLHSEHTILNSNVKFGNFFDLTGYYFFSDTLFKPKLKSSLTDVDYALIINDVNFMESKINQLGFNVNPVLTEVRLLNQSPLDIFLFKYSYRYLDSEYKTINPLFHKEHLFINK